MRCVSTVVMVSSSSGAYKLGTSPVFNTLLMSSSIASNTIWVSLKRNTAGWALMPAYNNISLRDSRHSDSPVWERHRHETA